MICEKSVLYFLDIESKINVSIGRVRIFLFLLLIHDQRYFKRLSDCLKRFLVLGGPVKITAFPHSVMVRKRTQKYFSHNGSVSR